MENIKISVESSIDVSPSEISSINEIFKKNGLELSSRTRRKPRGWVSQVAIPPELKILIDSSVEFLTNKTLIYSLFGTAGYDFLKKLANALKEASKSIRKSRKQAPYIILNIMVRKKGILTAIIEEERVNNAIKALESLPSFMGKLKIKDQKRTFVYNSETEKWEEFNV